MAEKVICLLEILYARMGLGLPLGKPNKTSSTLPPPPFTYILFLDQHFECTSFKNIAILVQFDHQRSVHIKTQESKELTFFFKYKVTYHKCQMNSRL